MNLVQEAAKSYEKLLDVEYLFVVGRKGQTKKIILTFEKEGFRHLAGFQYIRDHRLPRKPLTLYQKALEGKISVEYLGSNSCSNFSEVKSDVEGRWTCLCNLQHALDRVSNIYHFNKNSFASNPVSAYTKIDADYVVKDISPSSEISFFFMTRDSEIDKYTGCSIFPFDVVDYSAGQSQYKILQVVKYYKKYLCAEVIYQNPVYDPEFCSRPLPCPD